MSNMDTTRVLGATGMPTPVAGERTMVVPGGAGAPMSGATMQMPAGAGDAMRTQMGGVATCPVCKSSTPVMEPYCGDCGFLLTSTPVEEVALPVEEAPAAELVDAVTGRRYRLRPGVNTVGRQGTDVLTDDGTVSRNHARLTVEADKVIVEDLGSSNGTKVGDLRIGANQPTPAASGTPLRFGNWKLNLEMGQGGAAAQPGDQTIAIPGGDRTIVGEAPAASTEGTEAAPAVSPEGAAAPLADAVALLKSTDGPGSDIAITEGTVTIGRKAGNTLVLADAYLSGRHAEITTDATGTYLIDVGSTNGTVVNGQKLAANERQLLLEGDEIRLGQTTYLFETRTPTHGESEGDENAADLTADHYTEGAGLETSVPRHVDGEAESEGESA